MRVLFEHRNTQIIIHTKRKKGSDPMQNYQEYTKEELIKKIDSLERLNKELLLTFQKTERLEFGWTGNLGQWFWNYATNEVTFNPLKAEAIGYSKEELPETVPFQFFTEKIHPDDIERVMQLMRDHLKGETPVWEVKYRIQAKDGSWRVYQDRGKVTERNEEGKPLFLTGIVFDVTLEEQERKRLKTKNDLLTSQRKKDTLTSLYSRSAITVELVKYTNRSRKENKPLSLVFLSIDHYSDYEKNFGIVGTEEVLTVTGKIIQSALQKKHVAGRYRESAFLILLENTEKEDAYRWAETIREAVLETLFDLPKQVTISGGIAAYDSEETISELVQKAASKLTAARKSGGNQVIL